MNRIGLARGLCAVGLLLAMVAANDASAQSRRRRPAAEAEPATTPPADAAATPPATGSAPQASGTTPPADAAASTGARELFLSGQEAYQRGDYAGAIALWEQAIAIDPRPQLYFNLAQAYGRLGRIEDEMASLRRYLDGASPEDPTVASSRARLASLEQRLANTGIDLTGVYPGARVVVDGQERGTMPLHDGIGVRPGSHAIDVHLEGYEPFHSAVVVPAGDRVTVSIVLVRATEQAEDEHPMRLPIALYATGGALVVTGAAVGTFALIKGLDSVEGTSDGDRARTLAIVSDATLFPGLAIGATGLVIHLIRRGHDDERSTARTTVVPVVGRNHLGVAGTF